MNRLLPLAILSALAASPLAQGTLRLAHIGNSITAGSVSGVKPYPVKLQQLLGSGYQVENDGVSGCTLMKRANKPYWTEGKLANVFALKPNIVTIKLGTNDSKTANWAFKADFAKDLRALIDTVAGISSKPKIWLCLPAPAWPVNGVNSYTIDGEVVKNEIIPLIKQVAGEKGLPYIDLHTALSGMRSHFADGVHPDQAGQDTIAAVIHRALTAATGSRLAVAAPFARAFPSGGGLRVILPPGVAARAEILGPHGRLLETRGIGAGGGWIPLAGRTRGALVLSLETGPGGPGRVRLPAR